MRVQKLSKDVQTLFCVSVNLTNYKKAIEELVYNCLDANATSIAVRVNLTDCSIQVIDNGLGIHKRSFKLLGQVHTSSKYIDLSTFMSAPNTYGYRGQSLANIISNSKVVKITSRFENSDETWIKTFYNGKDPIIRKISCRPSKGTTVEVIGFLCNLYIQRQAVNVVQELQDIKTFLKQVTLIHSDVSISLRDDIKNEIVLKMHKNRDIYHKLQLLFNISKSDLLELKVEKNEYKASLFISKKGNLHDHWIFLNNRFLTNSKLHKYTQEFFLKALATNDSKSIKLKNTENFDRQSNQYVPFYILFLTCPYYDYDLISKGNQSILEFKDWTEINQLLEKVIKFYAGKLKLVEVKKNNLKNNKPSVATDLKEEVKNIMNKILGNNSKQMQVKQMQKGVNGKLIKRKFESLKIPKSISSKENKNILTCQTNNNTKNNKKVTSIKIDIKNNVDVESSFICSMKNDHGSKLTTNGPLVLPACDKYYVLQNKKLNCTHDQIAYKDQNQDLNFQNYELQTSFKKKYENSVSGKYGVIKKSKNCVKKPISNHAVTNIKYLRKSVNKHTVPIQLKQSRKYNISFLKSRDLLKTLIKTPQNISYYALDGKKNTEKNNELQCSTESNNYLTYYSHKYSDKRTDRNNCKKPFENKRRTTFIDKALQVDPERVCSINRFISEKSIGNFTKLSNYQIDKWKATTTKETFPKILEKNAEYHMNSSFEAIRNNSTYYCSYDSYYKKMLQAEMQSKYSENIGIRFTMTSSNVTMNMSNNKCYNTRHFKNKKNDDDIFDHHSKRKKANFIKDIHTSNTKEVVFISNTPSESENITINNTLNIEPLILCDDTIETPVYKDFTLRDQNNPDFLVIQSHDMEIHSQSIVSSNSYRVRSYSVPYAETRIKNQHQENNNYFELTFTKDIQPWELCETKISPNLQTEMNNFKIQNSYYSNRQDNENNSQTDYISLLNGHLSKPEFDDKCQINDFYQQSDISHTNESGMELHDISLFKKSAFELKQRLHFLPKGMSPIFDHCNSKSLGNYKAEETYLKNNLYSDFINQVQIISKVYEAKVQSANDVAPRNIEKFNHRVDKVTSTLTFTTESLKKAVTLSQVDNKFIATVITGNSDQLNYFVLFDQHAVHERIRLEDNLKEYFNGTAWNSIPLDDIYVKVTEDDVIYLHNYKEKFALLGIEWSVRNKAEIKVHSLPVAIIGKHTRDVDKILNAAKNLIFEEINNIKSQKCVSLYPRSIMDLVFSEACRYAIKFGDPISREKCTELIKSLSACKTPFQCAHGRPVMAVITDLPPETKKYQVNQAGLFKFKKMFNK